MEKQIIHSKEYGTGQFWVFDNGQYGEKIEIKNQDHYQILSSEAGKIYGLYCYKSNNTGNSCFGGRLLSVSSLSGELKEIFEQLLEKSKI